MKKFFSNKWVMFSIVSLCYTLWVIWIAKFWLLIGLGVIFDLYITERVPWAFWKLLDKGKEKRSKLVEWVDALIFAVIAATFIRMFFIEAFTIPTSSMEKNLLVGDYLFVSKFHYGPKLPNTPLSFPFAHHTLPLTKSTKSYLEWIKWDYERLPGFQQIKNNDVVVFNFPEGDTVVVQHQERSYYQIIREIGRDAVWNNFDIAVRPVDKQENYIKRCVAIPGDKIEIIGGQLFVNDIAQAKYDGLQYNYSIFTNGSPINPKILGEMSVALDDRHFIQPGHWIFPLTPEKAERLRSLPNVLQIVKLERPAGERSNYIFPHSAMFNWNEDFFGPLTIPRKGMTIELNDSTVALYGRAAGYYEGNTLESRDGKYFVNGEETDRYTFKMDYYWMMGDNRHNSADSRFWGFVPEDHIVGKAVLVWLSIDKDKSFLSAIRLGRMFRTIH